MEKNKVVEFPTANVAEQELSPEGEAAFTQIEKVMEEQDTLVSDMVSKTCRSFDAQAAEAQQMPIFIPMEAGLAITATYLNMISDEQGHPIESILDDVQELTQRINDVVNTYYEEKPGVSPNVYYYALIHAGTSSLRHQRLLNNVNDYEKTSAEGEE